MSKQQIIHFKLLKYLLIQLKNFGLNPSDWKIDRSSLLWENQIFLVHREDHQFKFVGDLRLNNGSLSWQKLTLLSL